MTPDHSYIVEQTANEYGHLLEVNTIDAIQEFMQILGPRLASVDNRWGYLTKTEGEKHITLTDGTFVSVDSFIYLPTQQVIDVLGNGADPDYGPARPSWAERPKRENNNWYPISDLVPIPKPKPNPVDNATLKTLQIEVDSLRKQIEELQSRVIKVGDRINLKTQDWNDHRGKYVSGDRNQSNHLIANRDGVGTWEQLTIGRE